MKRHYLAFAALALILSSCAAPKPQQPQTPEAEAQAKEEAREEKDKPPVRIGPDVIVAQDPATIWSYISKVNDWGTWCPKVTTVTAASSLSQGAMVNWQWEGSSVQSLILTVTENQEFDFQGAASSSKAIVRWTLRPSGSGTLVSLRAEVPYGSSQHLMDKLGPEMSEWMGDLQNALAKAPAPTPTPTPDDN